MSFMATALGLLLVFRTTNSYQRLTEARARWGRAVYITRELAQGVATALYFDDGSTLPDRRAAQEAASQLRFLGEEAEAAGGMALAAAEEATSRKHASISSGVQ